MRGTTLVAAAAVAPPTVPAMVESGSSVGAAALPEDSFTNGVARAIISGDGGWRRSGRRWMSGGVFAGSGGR